MEISRSINPTLIQPAATIAAALVDQASYGSSNQNHVKEAFLAAYQGLEEALQELQARKAAPLDR